MNVTLPSIRVRVRTGGPCCDKGGCRGRRSSVRRTLFVTGGVPRRSGPSLWSRGLSASRCGVTRWVASRPYVRVLIVSTPYSSNSGYRPSLPCPSVSSRRQRPHPYPYGSCLRSQRDPRIVTNTVSDICGSRPCLLRVSFVSSLSPFSPSTSVSLGPETGSEG